MARSNGRKHRVAVVRHGEYFQPHARRDSFALRDAGFEVDHICISEPGKPHFERVDGITVIRLPIRHKRGRLLRYLFEYTAVPLLAGAVLALRSVRQNYDYVEIDTMPTWLIAAAAIPKLRGSKVVLYMFEHMAELTATDKGLTENHWLIRLIDKVEMACIRAADQVLTPAERNRELYINRGIDADKIVFIPNCPDEPTFLQNVKASTCKYGSTEDPSFRIVTHGSLLERYGIHVLLEAIALLRHEIPELRLNIIGSGEFEANLKLLAAELSVDDIVIFVGPLPFERMAPDLLKADVGVGPYLLDLLPNKMMEYFLLGIPAIASDWPTLRRYFGNDTVKYVRPNDVAALVEALRWMYLNPAERAEQASRARDHYLDTLAWGKTKQNYLAVYGVAPALQTSNGPGRDAKRMTWLKFVLGQSRGPRNTASRLPTIISRFGLSTRKSVTNFEELLSITDRYSVTPTLPVTAVTARRNPKLVSWLRDRGVEIAAHGYVHNDYAAISPAEQLEHVTRARDELASLGFAVRGWRSPYSRWNKETVSALRETGFEYDASPVYEWPAYEQEQIAMSAEARADLARLCKLFSVRDASKRAVLPTTIQGLVQIPMSIPQDEDMVDRLHMNSNEMTRVWLRVLRDSNHHREAFVICLHPERARLCAEPLDATLSEARSSGDIWIAPLIDIADWWKERGQARITVSPDGGSGRWQVTTTASIRVVTSYRAKEFAGSADFEAEATRKPVVYAGPSWPEASCLRITEAGYAVERNGIDPQICAVDLIREFTPSTEPEEIIRALEYRENELVRVQPWPSGFKSCLSITGDIDALTLFDFAMRLKEFS